MKLSLLICLAVLLALCFVACAPPAAVTATEPQVEAVTVTPTPQAEITATPLQVVVFTDPVLETMIRKIMNKPTGDITTAEAEAVRELNLSLDGNDWTSPKIVSLKDIAQFPNLTNLSLNWALKSDGEAFDISPLSSLSNLEYLYFCCSNINDVSALAGMTKLRDLWIWNNNVTDISPLAGMTQLESLWINGNQITDISALANMKNLVYLYMQDNQITDLSPLAGLPKLTNILLSGNPVTDYSPLTGVYPNLVEKDFDLP